VSRNSSDDGVGTGVPSGMDLPTQDTVLLAALHQDDATFDALATRTAGADEPVTEVLSALTAEVDAGLDVALARPLPTVLPVGRERGAARRHRAGLAAAGAVALVLASGGVAAAATGNPLSPVRAMVAVVTGHHDDQPVAAGDAPGGGTDDPSGQDPAASGDQGKPSDLPTTAADQAQLNQLLLGISALIAHGNYVDAGTQLSAAQQVALTLTDPLASWFNHRIDVLTAQLERAIARDAAGQGKPTQPGNSGGQGKPTQPGDSGGQGKPTQPGNTGGHSSPTQPANTGGHSKPAEPGNSGSHSGGSGGRQG
jgi:hypothetical protein